MFKAHDHLEICGRNDEATKNDFSFAALSFNQDVEAQFFKEWAENLSFVPSTNLSDTSVCQLSFQILVLLLRY